jgi:omega-hydroxy-beta-dihydromenaquinone-9 sulfotransferase
MNETGSAPGHPDGGRTLASLLANETETSASTQRAPSALDSTRVWLWNTFFTNLCGVTFRDWFAILRDNRFAVDWPYWPQAAILTAGCGLNSLFHRKEMKAFGARLEGVRVHPPLFILGHWRSGTTLLHNMLALDEQFTFPNLYEVFFPHTFLCTEEYRAGQIAGLVPATRLIDSMAQGLQMPNEDEFATCAMSLHSPYMLWSFPRNATHYERYLTFRGVPAADVARWKSALVLFLKKLTLRTDRPMLLKSPPHTGRIKLLLDLFPEARFLHIRREPYTVFQSTRHLNAVLTRSLQFQKPDPADASAAVVRRYRLLYDAYFEERTLIPEGQLYEVAFEELERDPIGPMQQAYQALGLRGFETVLPRLEEYVATLAGYRKNSYPELPADLKAEVGRQWRQSFEEWGYPLG